MQIAELLPPQAYDFDPLLEFEAELETAARALDLEPWLVQRIKHPEREITINIPAVQDDGTSINVTGYRIQHSGAQGPSIGPVLISTTAHPAQLRSEAMGITLRNALLEIPLGGAAGGIVCDSARMSESEVRRVLYEYVSRLRDETGPQIDVLVPHGPDWVLRAITESAAQVRGRREPAGVIDSDAGAAAACPAILALVRRVLERQDAADLRVAVQGYGRRARALAEMFHRDGARIVAVADRSGGVLRHDGLDLSALAAYLADRGVVFGFPNAEPVSNADVLECDCDLLILAAAERQVGAHNAEHVQARVLAELAPNAVAVAPEHLPPHCQFLPHLLCGAAEIAVWFHAWQRGLTYSVNDGNGAAQFATGRVLSAFDRVQAAGAKSLLEAARRVALARLARTLGH